MATTDFVRSDYITSIALARSHVVHHSHEHEHEHDEPDHAHRRRRVRPAIIPDLRFEPTYLKRIAPHVHVERHAADMPEKGKGKQGAETITVDWGKVLWITTRDQVISPLLQGIVWGTASVFIVPLLAALGARVRGLWPKYSGPPLGHEGKGVGWLRSWGHSLVSGTGVGLAVGTK
ncbi:hypothetical protein EWM64_g7983 [Hericium alpestre]|uniref:Uncharacterized protein n=1 Tax=Hericium alpestre TaxID=135208 RepID=A0A4Y9ZPP1_9AGAM|nr:hypothetical protein EWM64_g7983 [Hericium alpestre]